MNTELTRENVFRHINIYVAYTFSTKFLKFRIFNYHCNFWVPKYLLGTKSELNLKKIYEMKILSSFQYRIYGTKYSIMDQVKFAEDSLKIWSDTWSAGRPYSFKFFKGYLPQFLLGPFLNILFHVSCNLNDAIVNLALKLFFFCFTFFSGSQTTS